jgi:hypothetical protein
MAVVMSTPSHAAPAATNRWTNAYGQTLAVGMYVGMNSACQVRFREHLVGSGSNGWYTGAWHDADRDWVMSSDNHFHVPFLSPDHLGVDHAGCSQAWTNIFHDISSPNPCFYY